MISVILPTIRQAGIDLVERALQRQTHYDFEWLIVSPVELETPEWSVFIKTPPKTDQEYWTLSRDYNRAIERASGDLIVSWNDYTFSDADVLEKMWFHYENNPKALVSGVGHKYTDDSFTAITWRDPRARIDMGTFYECFPNDIEWNFCSVPKSALVEVGGFDEEMDKLGFGMNDYQMTARLNELGYKFYLDQTMHTYSLEHERNPRWDEDNLINGGYTDHVNRLKSEKRWPVLDYLDDSSVIL